MKNMTVKLRAAFPALVAVAFLVPVLAGCATAGRQRTIAVSGVGTVRVQPDTIRMSVALRHTAGTTRAALAEVNRMTAAALEILLGAGLEERNISTAALRFSPDYEWGPQGRTLLGQRAEQVIGFSIDDADAGNGRAYAVASDVIDRLIGINGIELLGMTFGVRDTAELHYRARELAHRDALEKARQYARLSGQRIVGTLGIFEEGAFPAPARAVRSGVQMQFAADAPAVAEGSPVLLAGETEISVRILVEFLVR